MKMNYLRKLIFLLIALSFSGLSYGQFLTESFDAATFPPTGWTQTQVSGTGLWTRVTAGTNPTCTPHTGAGMIKYDSYNYAAGASAVMISPVMDLTTITATSIVEFWMYRDALYPANLDTTSLYLNTTASLTGATLLGDFHRNITLTPIETGLDGWYKYQIAIPAGFNTATNYLLIKGTGAYGNNMFIDDIRVYTPVAADAAPTNITFTGTTVSGTTVGWTDNSTNENGFNVYMSTNATTGFTKVGTTVASTTTVGVGTTYSKAITGLLDNATYYFKVTAVTDLESASLDGNTTTIAGTLSGIKTIGVTGDYPSLTAAFAAINTNGLVSSVELSLQADYVSTVETFPIVPSPIATATKTIKVYPSAAGLSIVSSDTVAIFNMSGCKYITFDGRVNAMGNIVDLTIENTSIKGNTFYFKNDASYNNINYCLVKGVNSYTAISSTFKGGIITFGPGVVTGNDYNKISHCNITSGATTATVAINSNTWVASATNISNDYNSLDTNNIYDYFSATTDCFGVATGIDNSYWSIKGNRFYQTAPRVFTTSAMTYYGISFNGVSEGNQIQGNVIGYASNTETGVTNISGTSNMIKGMRIWVGINAETSIQGNIINGFDQTSSRASATTNAAPFIGIRVGQGLFDVGSIEKNRIGSMTDTSTIVVRATSTTAGTSPCAGIFVQTTSQGYIYNNEIGGISIKGNGTGTMVGFTGIVNEAPYQVVMYNNRIGGNVANSIMVEPINGQLCGVSVASAAKVTLIDSNFISNLSHLGANAGRGVLASVIGIKDLSINAGQYIIKNSISNIGNTNATATACVHGIYYAGPTTGTNLVESNKIFNLTLSTSSTAHATAAINGIYAAKGLTSYQNNMITLGNNLTTAGYSINGINDSLGTNNYYHNTIYIGGNNVVSSGNTFAFNSLTTTVTRNIQNNIFVNSRSNASGTAINYAISVAGTTANPAGLTLNNNIYHVSGTGGVFGYFNSADVADLATWKTNVGQDANSLSVDPLLVNPTAVIPDLHLTVGSPAESAGAAVTTVTEDIDGDVRANNTPSDIGADAGVYDVLLPSATFVPANASTNIAVGTTVEVTFNEMVRKVDNTFLDNSNIASVITFVKVSDNSNVAFTATWDAATKKIVATPSVALANGATYKFSISGLEDYSNNLLTGPDSTRFTTIASTDATLSDLTSGGTTVAGFVATTITYNVVLPSGTTVVPTVTATTTDVNATKVITPAASLPGATTVVVTAQDGTTQITYTINYTVAAANDATLSDLKVNGTTVAGFAPTTYTYNVALPYGTVTVPTVLGIAADANATVTYVHAAALPGVDSVKVTAQDGVTNLLYLVNFTITPAATDASLADLTSGGTTVAGFASTTYIYNVVLPAGTTVVPTVTATTTDANATKVITPAASLPGATTVVVTAEDGTTQQTYTINYTLAVQTYTVTFNVVGTNGTLAATVDAAAITSPATVNAGKNVVFTATPDANYSVKEWKLDGTVVAGNTTNTYTLSNLAANSTVTVEFKLNVGVNEATQNVVSIYPNPANDVVNVKMNNTIHKIAVVNMNGQVVAESEINNNEGSINVSTIANGMYFLRIETATGITMNKIQIVK